MGTIFTVSGVCCLFRKDVFEEIAVGAPQRLRKTLMSVGKNSNSQRRHHAAAPCFMLGDTPERLYGLYKQRLRWAQGGAETIIKYFFSGLALEKPPSMVK